MNDKLSLYNIAELLAEKTGVETDEIEKFIIELITLINEGIRKDGFVKVKGFGTFKIILVKERESVHINTGERIVIPAHHKLSFKPEEELKELINQPFSIFETVEATDENLKKNADLSLSEIKEDADNAELTNTQSLISDYKIVDDEPEQNSSEDKKEEVNIIPSIETPDMNQQVESLSVNENEENTLPSEEDKPIMNVNTSDNEENDTSLQANYNQQDEIITPPMPSQLPTKSKKSPDKKKKSKSSSLMALYLVLILLLFILAGCIWYYFAYSRSFNSFDKDYSTKVSNDTFVLPGDTLSEQQALEKAKIPSKDSTNNTIGGSPANTSEAVTSKSADQSATSPSRPAATTTNKPSTTETNNAKPATSNNTKVLAKIKMESGNRLTLVAEKYYGNKLFWVYIYDFNKDKIGANPDNVKAGMEIMVPSKEIYGIDANNAGSLEKARKLQAQLMAGKK
ncbi:MAG: HU family DNA-binding protein [Tannerella sp.]|jgi:nucleoid DNA-binding protein/nucleoid-associated protein YgaU|nr:HU family DNA-binding protein [Tannerella sp.]